MATLKIHMKSVLYSNFDAWREPLQVRFSGQATREIEPFSIRYVDGFSKGLICHTIAALVDHLETCHPSYCNKSELKFAILPSTIGVLWKCLVSIRLITPWIQTILCHILQKNLRWSTKGFADEELDSDELRPLLASLKFFKAQYNHKSSMAAYCYDALRYLLSYGQFLIHILFSLMIWKYRMIFWCFQDGVFWTHPVCLHFTTHIQHLLGLGQETSEKQPPSALDFVALFSLAMKEHEESSGKKLPLVTALGNVVTEYNRGIAVKKWKVDSSKKKLIMHILRCPRGVLEILAEHYDDHKHSASGSEVLSSNVFLLPQVCWRSIKIKQIVWMLQDSTQLLISALHNAVKLFHDVKLMVGKSLVIWLNEG